MKAAAMHDPATLARFAGVGVGAAFLLFVITWLFAAIGLPAFVAGTAGYAVAFAAAYLAQRDWSFRGRHTHRHALPRYVAAQVLAALASGGAAHVAAYLGFAAMFASACATVVASGISLVLSLFWVFPPRAGEAVG